MGFEKFDQHNKGEYWKKYFEKDRVFYDTIGSHIVAALATSESSGLDIGAGPGVGAKIMDSLNLKTTVYGYEPSETASDGTSLAKKLEEKNSSVKYQPVQCGMEAVATPEAGSLDYILALRTAHEIAESLGSKERFFEELNRLITGLKKQGVIIIAEPQYANDFMDEAGLLETIQKYKLEKIGHCHVPSDYITDIDMKQRMQESGLTLVKEDNVPDDKLQAFLLEKGLPVLLLCSDVSERITHNTAQKAVFYINCKLIIFTILYYFLFIKLFSKISLNKI